LANARKYAATDRIRVVLQLHESKLQLQIQDWGRGFDPADVKESQHLGLVGMRERAALLNGACQVTSQPGVGAQVDVFIPLG